MIEMAKEYHFKILKNYPLNRPFLLIKGKTDSFLSYLSNMILGR